MHVTSKLRLANLVLRNHPDDAEAYALERIEELRAEGDGEGARSWQDILEALRSMTSQTRT